MIVNALTKLTVVRERLSRGRGVITCCWRRVVLLQPFDDGRALIAERIVRFIIITTNIMIISSIIIGIITSPACGMLPQLQPFEHVNHQHNCNLRVPIIGKHRILHYFAPEGQIYENSATSKPNQRHISKQRT